jgi:hypothetical protein
MVREFGRFDPEWPRKLAELARLGFLFVQKRRDDSLANSGTPCPVLATTGNTGTPNISASLAASIS